MDLRALCGATENLSSGDEHPNQAARSHTVAQAARGAQTKQQPLRNAAAARWQLPAQAWPPSPRVTLKTKKRGCREAAALEIVNKWRERGQGFKKEGQGAHHDPRRRRVFQDGIEGGTTSCPNILVLVKKLKKGVPSNDASPSMRRTLREAGVKVPGIAKKKTDFTVLIGVRALPPPWLSLLH